MTGLVMTKTKTQRGLVEPITHVGKPRSIQVEMGEERAVNVTGLGGKIRALVRRFSPLFSKAAVAVVGGAGRSLGSRAVLSLLQLSHHGC